MARSKAVSHIPPCNIDLPTHAHIFADWATASISGKKAHIEFLLESLEHRDAEIRFTNARRLLYILQGPSEHATCWSDDVRAC